MTVAMLPALPNAQSVTPAQLADFGTQIVEWAESIDDVGQVRDAAAKWAAITEYVRRTSREGIAEAEATLRRLEVRVGQLNARPGQGSRTSPHAEKLHPGRAAEFELMAEHEDIVEQVIAESDDDSPPSRRKVLATIKEPKRPPVTAGVAQATMIAEDLRKVNNRLEQVRDDKRFASNRKRLDSLLRHEVRRAQALSLQIIGMLNGQRHESVLVPVDDLEDCLVCGQPYPPRLQIPKDRRRPGGDGGEPSDKKYLYLDGRVYLVPVSGDGDCPTCGHHLPEPVKETDI